MLLKQIMLPGIVAICYEKLIISILGFLEPFTCTNAPVVVICIDFFKRNTLRKMVSFEW
jgi:hypothetical protein